MIYADTSLLVSLYAPDSNSARAAAQMKSAPLPIHITQLGELELANALALRVFRRELTQVEVAAALAAFRADREAGVFFVSPLPTAAFEKARQLAHRRTPRLGTRTIDVLHVASALVLGARTFLTFDGNQEKLARAEGLRTL
jgi:predicted nucleic acid-binding protein